MLLDDSKKPRRATIEFTAHQIDVALRAFRNVVPGPCGECKEAIAMLESAFDDLTRERTTQEKVAALKNSERAPFMSEEYASEVLSKLHDTGWDLVRIDPEDKR
jgi:hypothetical protein